MSIKQGIDEMDSYFEGSKEMAFRKIGNPYIKIVEEDDSPDCYDMEYDDVYETNVEESIDELVEELTRHGAKPQAASSRGDP